MMSDYQNYPEYLALLRRVCESPADDAPRLILADWIEEHGDDERAEFIRTQVRYTDYNELGKLPGGGVFYTKHRGFISEIRLTCAEFVGQSCRACDVLKRDICPRCNGTGHIDGIARELFERHPITRVVLTDKRPLSFGGRFLLHNADHRLASTSIGETEPSTPSDHLPEKLHTMLRWFAKKPHRVTELVKSFPSEAAALDALSDACVAYGRSLVGLPAMEKQCSITQ